jgi:hypothetical protein
VGCTDCYQTLKEQQAGVAILQQQAKALAVKDNCNVYIYQSENGPAIMVEAAAINAGIQPTLGVITPMRPVTAK